METDASAFFSVPVRHFPADGASLAYRQYGAGPSLLLIHGFPLHGFTYRRVLPILARSFTCTVVDMVGAGESRWSEQADFSPAAQAARIRGLMSQLSPSGYFALGHDTGGAVARHLALQDPGKLSKLALINTEIPRHRPPWVPLYQRVLGLPGSGRALRWLLASDSYLRSPACMGGCFHDPRLLDGEFRQQFIDPLINSARRTEGMIRLLRAFDWAGLDRFAVDHAQISAPVLFIWGREDRTFPETIGQKMRSQFRNPAGWCSIPQACLLPHEERPQEVCAHLQSFLQPGVERASA